MFVFNALRRLRRMRKAAAWLLTPNGSFCLMLAILVLAIVVQCAFAFYLVWVL